MRWTASSAVAALLLVAPPATAQQSSVPDLDPRDNATSGSPPIGQRIHFALDFQGVPGCDERGLFEDAMRFRLWSIQMWWDPFAPVSPRPLTVRVTRSGGWFAAVEQEIFEVLADDD